jgi:hypothetical protein
LVPSTVKLLHRENGHLEVIYLHLCFVSAYLRISFSGVTKVSIFPVALQSLFTCFVLRFTFLCSWLSSHPRLNSFVTQTKHKEKPPSVRHRILRVYLVNSVSSNDKQRPFFATSSNFKEALNDNKYDQEGIDRHGTAVRAIPSCLYIQK